MARGVRLARRRHSIEAGFESRAIFRFDRRDQGVDLFMGRAFILKFGQLLVFVLIDGQNIFIEGQGSL